MTTNLISCNLTARQMAKSLLPHMAKLERKYINIFKAETSIEITETDTDNWESYLMEEFLLFPPDLFAFTSSILSSTGAYHLVVSPPRYKEGLDWQPYDKDKKWFSKIFGNNDKWKKKGQWVDEVRKVGLKWRLLLNGNFSAEKLEKCKSKEINSSRVINIREKVGILVEKIENDEKRLAWIAPTKRWVPDEVRDYWEEFRREMSPMHFCHDGETGNIEDLLCDEERFEKQNRKENLPQIWKAFCSLITLHAIADEACIGWGLREVDDELERDDSNEETYKKYLEKDEIWGEYINFKEDFGNRRWVRAREEIIAKNREIPENFDQIFVSKNPREKDFLDVLKPFFKYKEKPQIYAEELLKKYGTMSSINNMRCRILPKRHTPSVGLTLRALSSNLAYHRSSIDVRWRTEYEVKNGLIKKMEKIPPNERTFSILLLPWALDISSLDFKTIKADPRLGMKEDYGFFAYSPRNGTFDENLLIKTLNGAKEETPDIDMIILPEYALAKDEIKEFEKIIGSNYKVSTYVAGIRNSNEEGTKRHFYDNMVLFRVGAYTEISGNEIIDFNEAKEEDFQHKHHRWRLNRSQIETYHLGHILSPNKDWWEAIKIRRRKVTFVNIGEELTVCPLICEDLARQDPIADLIRTVGPSLVITILMDGPQKKERWSAKYASVLAEDPGCAIITLTSLGMVKKSIPPNITPSRIVALWNDGVSFAREIELKEGAVGILLNLSVEAKQEVMADGRREIKSTNCIKLGGIHQIYPK